MKPKNQFEKPRALMSLTGALALATQAAMVLTTQAATVVHDAARDLCLNTMQRQSFTNAYGGVWSYLHADSSTGERSPLEYRFLLGAEPNNNLGQVTVYEAGLSRGWNTPPFVMVNPSVYDDSNGFVNNRSYGAIEPGGLTLHPGYFAGDDQYAVLRFTVPRDGTYAVTARACHRGPGSTGVQLLVNGMTKGERIVSLGSSSSGWTDLSVAAAQYRAGDTIEFVVDGDGSNDSNINAAAGVEFKIAEDVLGVIDAAAAMRANANAEMPTNPWTVDSDEWACTTMPNNWPAVDKWRNDMSATAAFATDFSGWAGEENTLAVNKSGVYAAKLNDGNVAETVNCHAVVPGEFLINPCWYKAPSLQVKPDIGGFYDIGIVARDLCRCKEGNAYNGVNITLRQGFEVVATCYVSGEMEKPCETIYLKNVYVAPDIPIEVTVDANAISDDGEVWKPITMT